MHLLSNQSFDNLLEIKPSDNKNGKSKSLKTKLTQTWNLILETSEN